MHAVGPEAYTSWEGYVEKEGSKGRAVIGLSYDKLCQYVKPGNTILLSDGTITIKVCWLCVRLRNCVWSRTCYHAVAVPPSTHNTLTSAQVDTGQNLHTIPAC